MYLGMNLWDTYESWTYLAKIGQSLLEPGQVYRKSAMVILRVHNGI